MNNTSNATQSPGWDKVNNLVTANPGHPIPGFPFSEGFPEMYDDQTYHVILNTGRKITATVNESEESTSKVLVWKVCGKNHDSDFIAGWKLIET
jgi:hypothetical protein